MRLGRRRLAARYLRSLATLEALIVHGHISEARRLIDGIDPEEARSLASEIESPVRPGGTRGTGRSLRLLVPPGQRKIW